MNPNRYLLLLCLLLPLTLCVAQRPPALVNLRLTRPEKPIMYTGVDNLLALRGELPGKYFRLERSGGPVELKAGTTLTAVLRYTETGTDTFRLYSGEQLLLEKTYEIKSPGTYAARLSRMRDTALGRADLAAAGGLELIMPETYYKPAEPIVSYKLTAVVNGRKVKTWTCEGMKFPDDFLPFVQQQAAGAQFHFEEITFRHKIQGLKKTAPVYILLKD